MLTNMAEVSAGGEIVRFGIIGEMSDTQKPQMCRWNIDAMCNFRRYKYFRFWLILIYYFRLSVAVAITCQHLVDLAMAINPRFAV